MRRRTGRGCRSCVRLAAISSGSLRSATLVPDGAGQPVGSYRRVSGFASSTRSASFPRRRRGRAAAPDHARRRPCGGRAVAPALALPRPVAGRGVGRARRLHPRGGEPGARARRRLRRARPCRPAGAASRPDPGGRRGLRRDRHRPARPTPKAAARLHEVTAGNPFFVEEVVQELAAEGALEGLTSRSGPVPPHPGGGARADPPPGCEARQRGRRDPQGRRSDRTRIRSPSAPAREPLSPARLFNVLGDAVALGVIAELPRHRIVTRSRTNSCGRHSTTISSGTAAEAPPGGCLLRACTARTSIRISRRSRATCIWRRRWRPGRSPGVPGSGWRSGCRPVRVRGSCDPLPARARAVPRWGRIR